MSSKSTNLTSSAGRISSMRRISPALDGRSVLAALQRHNGERMFGGTKISACFVDRVHFGSRIGVVIDYTVRVAGTGDGETDFRLFGQLPWADVDAAASRAERKLARQEQDGSGEVPHLVQIPEWGMLLRRPCHDERVGGLWLLKPRERWSQHVIDDETAELAGRFDRATLLTHRFAKRAVLRLAHDRHDGTPSSAIMKVYRRGSTAAQASADLQSRLFEALSRRGSDVVVPQIDTVYPGLAALLMQDVTGVPLSALPDEERTTAMTAAGKALARLHSLSIEGLGAHSLDSEVRLLRDWVEFTSILDPASSPVFTRKLADVELALAEAKCPRPCVIHRDFHERQLIHGSGSATLIDFDTVSIGDPAQDIGNFLAHLTLAELLSGTPADISRTNFLDGYSAAAGDVGAAASILAHERATRLRLALINWFNERNRDAAVSLLDGI